VIPYGLIRRLKGGDRIVIYPTMRCNQKLKCRYCEPNGIANNRPYLDKELTAKQWIDLLDRFTGLHKTQEAFISGGEPDLYKDVWQIIDYLTSNKICVTVQTNGISVNNIFKAKPSDRLRILANYHHQQDMELFLINFYTYDYRFSHVVAKELDTAILPVKSTVKKCEGPEEYLEHPRNVRFQIAPDGMIFTHYREMMEYIVDKNNKRIKVSA